MTADKNSVTAASNKQPTKMGVLFFNLRQIVQIVDNENEEFLVGKRMQNPKVITSEDCSLSVLVKNGKISAIGDYESLNRDAAEKVDCEGGCLLPGFVDAHSHPVFAGDRVHEFAMKLAGASYLDVQKAGGGIHFTTEKTRAASESELLEDFRRVANEMLQSGTTTLEAKSGYGLDEETELKMIRVLERAAQSSQLEISVTFCGAHAVPKGSTESKQTQLIIETIIPKLEKEISEGYFRHLENVDIFCEKGVFELESTRKILNAARSIGLRGNIHADELYPLGGAELAAETECRAASHLEEISPNGIKAMSEKGVVAVLLPTTAYILRLRPPPARDLINSGVIVALGSDFNPNAPCLNMGTVMHLACVNMRLSMAEAIVAATLNSAHSIGRGKTHGAIAVGRVADFVLIDATSWEHFIYRLGSQHCIIRMVIKAGQIIHSKD